MSALLDKLLVAKISVAVQTDWKNDVVETRDVAVSTDRLFSDILSHLPSTRSMSAQTEVSALRSKDKSVATDLEITGLIFYFFLSCQKFIKILLTVNKFLMIFISRNTITKMSIQ